MELVVCDVEFMVKVELCEVLEVRRVGDGLMAVILFCDEDVLRLICGYRL